MDGVDVDALLARVDILAYISQYCDFEEKGGEYWALSPLKEESTPSFSVNTDDQVFFDFSSGKGGNAIWFTMLYYKCSYDEAVNRVATYVGLADISELPKMPDAVSVAKKYAKKNTKKKQSNGLILDDNYMDRFIKSDKTSIWLSEGIPQEQLDRFSVMYDQVGNRLVFPIRNVDGKIINVCGRTLDDNWHEKKLRKYTYYHELGALDTVGGVYENRDIIKERGEIIIFEGMKSVMMAAGFGYKNAGAIMTSHLNDNQVKILAKLGVRTVFALDKGVNISSDRGIKFLSRYVPIEYIYDKDNLLEEKMAPVDAGAEVWEELYKNRRRFR